MKYIIALLLLLPLSLNSQSLHHPTGHFVSDHYSLDYPEAKQTVITITNKEICISNHTMNFCDKIVGHTIEYYDGFKLVRLKSNAADYQYIVRDGNIFSVSYKVNKRDTIHFFKIEHGLIKIAN